MRVSAAGRLSALIGGGEVISSDALSVASSAALTARTQGTMQLEALEKTSVMSKELEATVETMRLSAVGADGEGEIDVRTATELRAMSGSDMSASSGGGLEGTFVRDVDMTAGGDMALGLGGSVGLTSGGSVDMAADGPIMASTRGTATVGASSAIGQISEDVELIAGGDMAVTAGGMASFEASSLKASLMHDVSASTASASLVASESLTVDASAIRVRSADGVELQSSGASVSLGGGSTAVEFVSVAWRSPAAFVTHQSTLPEPVSDVSEIVIRRSSPGSPLMAVASAGGSTKIYVDVGTVDARNGNINGTGAGTGEGVGVTWMEAWSAAVPQTPMSLDGLRVQLSAVQTVMGVRLRSSAPQDTRGTFDGWSEAEILLGQRVGGALRVASASNVETVAGKDMLLSAQDMSVGAAGSVDVSASEAARLASTDMIVHASESLETVTRSLSVTATDGMDVASRGTLSGSFGAVSLQSGGASSVVSGGDLALAGAGGGSVTLSEGLDVSADEATLRANGALSAYAGDGLSLIHISEPTRPY